jgi:O-antigen/teichoic acid export membrane protein
VSAVTCARVVSLLAAAVQLPLLTHDLSATEYAIVASAIATGNYVSIASAEPSTLAFQRFPGTLDERSSFRSARASIAKSASIVCCAAVVLGLLTHSTVALLAAGGWGMGLASMRFVSIAWLMWLSPWRYAVCLMMSTSCRTAVLVGLIAGGVNPEAAVGIAGIVSAAVGIGLAPRARGALRGEKRWPRGLGVSLAMGSAGLTIVVNLDQVLLPHLIRASLAGVYAAMANFGVLTLGGGLGLIVTNVFPRALREWDAGRQDAVVHLLNRLVALTIVLAAFCALLLSCVGAAVLAEVTTSGFVDVRLCVCLMYATAIYYVSQIQSWLTNFRLGYKWIRNSSVIAACSNVGMFFLLLPLIGIYGAAIATSGAFGVYGLLMSYKSPHRKPVMSCVCLLVAASVISLVPSEWCPIAVGATAEVAGLVWLIALRGRSGNGILLLG